MENKSKKEKSFEIEEKKSKIALMEEQVLKWWDEKDVFRKSLKKRQKGKPFVFYEGPPTANGMPHPGHVLGRCFKDIFLRYKSMQGYYVPRRAGWDTHGLPVEIEVEKKLGIKSKSEIEKFGIAEFNRQCKESVWKYKDEWEKLTRRIGFWLEMENPYITYENSYIETLWWVIGKIFNRGLLVQDYKVLPYCARCGTGLSSHEIAQGYKTIRDKTIYVKFPIKITQSKEESLLKKMKQGFSFDESNDSEIQEYFLVWTTTPWTLPANVALAVNPALKYVKAKKENEIIILAKSRLGVLGDGWKIIEEISGKDLFNMEYRQVFSFFQPDKKAFFVVGGEFVSDKDGSGIVHIAPAYGEDDMRVAKENDLPVLHAVLENGEFSQAVKWQGRFVKDVDAEIINDLNERNLIFKEEMYEHEYPFCWRCDTPILYYARKSWFVKMTKLKKEVLANNQKINWVPAHLKEGRFGEWLAELKDWAFSRDRYWGTPLPIWQCGKCKETRVVSNMSELGELSRFRNHYFLMRHGEAISNKKGFTDIASTENHLTEKGKKEINLSLKNFRKVNPDLNIDIIISSPVLRTQETAELTADFFGVSRQDIIFDESIQEINVGIFNGKPSGEYHKYFSGPEEKFIKAPPQGETLSDLRKRMVDFIKKTEDQYQGKNVLVISHEYPFWMLETALMGLNNQAALAFHKKRHYNYIQTAEIMEVTCGKLPLGIDGQLDLHKPYIDGVDIFCQKCREKMERTPEVADVWFDSGAMPFAQIHFPFAQIRNSKFEIRNSVKQIPFPADFICEGVDQTRGWFYTLLAVSTLLETGVPYKNVISLGHILDKHGKKMSKSKKNYVDPLEIGDKYGIDALRWYFFTVSSAGEPKRFDERDVLDAQRKSVMVLLNIFNFLNSYSDLKKRRSARLPALKSLNILDRWILSRLSETSEKMVNALENYDALASSRSLAEFLDDFSNWYLRRSRDRFQHPKSKADYSLAVAVFLRVFESVLKLGAPFMPFVSEHLWIQLKKDSIHWQDYPKSEKEHIDKKLNYDMIKTREIVSMVLKKRAEAGIKVRQPLNQLKVNPSVYEQKLKIKADLLDLIKEEVNVKEISIDNTLKEDLWLDTEITPELREEGAMREFIRNIQQLRKELKLTGKDLISIKYYSDDSLREAIEKFENQIKNQTLTKKLIQTRKDKLKNIKEICINENKVWIEVMIHHS